MDIASIFLTVFGGMIFLIILYFVVKEAMLAALREHSRDGLERPERSDIGGSDKD